MSSTGNTNPGNFANRPKEEVVEIAKKGGQASHGGGFASMDPEKQVISIPSSSNISEIDVENVYRRKLHPWVGKPPADRLKRVARQLRRPERRAEVLLEQCCSSEAMKGVIGRLACGMGDGMSS